MNNRLINRCLTYLLIICSSLIIACEEGIISKELREENYVQIYLSQLDEDIRAIEIKSINEHSYLVFGVTGKSMDSKFDGNGKLFLKIVTSDGHSVLDSCIRIGSEHTFPSNIVESAAGEYLMIWNEAYGDHRLVEVTADDNSVALTITDLALDDDYGYVNCLAKAIDGDGYVMLALGHQLFNGTKFRKTIFIRSDNDFTSFNTLSQYEYDPAPISGFSDNDLAFIELVHHNLFIGHNGLNYFFNGPYGDSIVLMHVGDMEPVFSSSEAWITTINNPGNNYMDCLLTDQEGSGSFFVSQLDLEKRYGSIKNLQDSLSSKQLFSFDNSRKMCLDDEYIVGTSIPGQVLIQGTQAKSTANIIIGEQYPYEAAGFVRDENGNLLIVGTTRLHNIDQRIFLIKYAL